MDCLLGLGLGLGLGIGLGLGLRLGRTINNSLKASSYVLNMKKELVDVEEILQSCSIATGRSGVR